MKYIIYAFIFVFVVCNSYSQSYLHPVNLDFEGGEFGTLPFGWLITEKSTDKGYKALLTNDNPHSGKNCMALSYDGVYSPNDDNNDGSVFQSINAIPYRGKKIKITAYIRAQLKGINSSAHLWMRVRRSDEQLGFYNLGEDSPVVIDEWQKVEIWGTIDEQATLLNFGLMLKGTGNAYLDDVNIEVIQNPADKPIPSRKLTDREIKNISSFAQVYSYTMNFYPSFLIPTINKEDFLYKGLFNSITAANSTELKNKLESLFHPFAPGIIFSNKSENTKTNRAFEIKKPNDNCFPYSWMYVGANTNIHNDNFMAKLVKPGDLARGYEGVVYQVIDVADKVKKTANLTAKVKLNPADKNAFAAIIVQAFNENDKMLEDFKVVSERVTLNKWNSINVDFAIPDSAATLKVALLVNGEARGLFDDVQLKIDNKNYIQNSSFEEFLMNLNFANWKMPKESMEAGYEIGVDTKDYTVGKLAMTIDVINQKYLKIPEIGNYQTLKLDKDLYCYIPLALYSDSVNTYPLPTIKDTLAKGKTQYYMQEAADLISRFSPIVEAWSIFKQFNYNTISEEKIDNALKSAIEKAALINNEYDLKDILKEMLAIYPDNNMRVWLNSETTAKYYSMPFTIKYINNNYYISNTGDENKYPLGAQVIAINGKPTDDYIKTYLKKVSYNTKNYGITKALAEFKYSLLETEPVKFKFKTLDGKTIESQVKRELLDRDITDFRPDPIYQIKEGYFYLDMTKLTESEIAQFFRKNISHVKAVIFDLRGLTYISHHFFGFMTNNPIIPISWKIPVVSIPDKKDAAFKTIIEKIRSRGGLENVKTLVLTDENTASMAEAHIQLLKQNKFTKIIGRATSGNPGSVIGFYLPCDLNVSYTAIYPANESQNIELGKPIEPDIKVPFSLESLKNRNDEILQKAIEIITQDK